jgi:glycosyltransferase involved in cell wall biosynthesis
LEVAAGDVVISYVKRLADLRWHEFFFRSARLVAESNERVRFVCVGRGVSQLSGTVRRLFDSSSLLQRVLLLEHASDVAEVYGGSDVVVSASGREGFPNSIGEAMATGVPCVVTDVGDSAFLVGNTGRVVPFGDVKSFADAMRAMVELGPEGRNRLGVLARARTAEHFSVERMVKEYLELYRSVGPRRRDTCDELARCAE